MQRRFLRQAFSLPELFFGIAILALPAPSSESIYAQWPETAQRKTAGQE